MFAFDRLTGHGSERPPCAHVTIAPPRLMTSLSSQPPLYGVHGCGVCMRRVVSLPPVKNRESNKQDGLVSATLCGG